MQPCEVAAQERKPRTRELRRRGKVEQSQALAEVSVIFRREVKRGRRAPTPDFHVVVGRGARRRARMREIGQLQQEVAQLDLNAFELGFEALDLVTETRNLRQQRRRVCALAL